MKSNPISLYIAAVVAFALAPFFTPGLRAQQEQSAGDINFLLTSGPWRITSQKGSVVVRIFKRDGTFSTLNQPAESGRWSLTRKTLVLTYPTTKTDVFLLPLKAAGTYGNSKEGEPVRAVLDKTIDLANPQVTPVPATTAAASAVPAGAPAAVPITERAKAESLELLVSGPWRMTGATFFAIRSFDANGTFTTVKRPDFNGTWEVVDNSIVLTFKDGHKNTLIMPLDEKGSKGVDRDGKVNITAVLQTEPPPAPEPPDEIDKQEITKLLVSAPWRIKGPWWATIRIFAADGTFTTKGNGGESGTWTISDTAILLTFKDKHIDRFLLPLDAKGTDGADRDGAPMFATLLDPAEAGKAATATTTDTPPKIGLPAQPPRPYTPPDSVYGTKQPH